MNLKTLWIAIALLFVTLSSLAQTTKEIKLPVDKYEMATNFKCVEVIDKRPVKTHIGFTKKGNEPALVTLIGDFEATLLDRINKMFLPKEDAREVAIIVWEFEVSEISTAMNERGVFRMELEFVQKKDAEYYSWGSHFVEVEKNTLSATLNSRIIQGFVQWVKDFNLSGWETQTPVKIQNPHTTAITFQLQKIPPLGKYASFSRLIRNEPLEEFNYIFTPMESHPKIQRYRYEAHDEKYKQKRIMFISDGNDLYMHASRYCYRKYFLKAKHYGKYIYFEDKFSDADVVSGGALIGGLMGAGISGMATNKWRGVILDTSSGEVSLLTQGKLMDLTLKDHREILEVYKASKRKRKDLEQAIISLNKKLEE